MDTLKIASTKSTPEVHFASDGNLSLIGRSLPEDTAKFYAPIQSWIDNCTLEMVTITINLDYMNSSSAQQISKFLQSVRHNQHIKNCKVNWYYEEGDEDNLEFGKEVMHLTDLPFQFYETAEFKDN